MNFFGKTASVSLMVALVLGGCAATDGSWNERKTVSTVLGAVGGALLGNQVGSGSGRTIATIFGALSDGVLGEWIASRLDDRDKQALAVSTEQALTSGKTVQWQSEHSGASAKIREVSSKTVVRDAQLKRSPVVAKTNNLAVLNQQYQAVKSANLRAAPDARSEKVGGLRVGQSFTALGKTQNDWLAVGRKGVLVGYVHAPLAASLATAQSNVATDLDSISTAQGQESKTVNACQAADGAWDLG